MLTGLIQRNEFSLVINQVTINGAIALTRFFMGQMANSLKLFYVKKEKLTEYQIRLIKAIYSVREEVKNGKVQVSRVTDVLNKELPNRLHLTPGKVSGILSNELGLKTDKSTGNLSYLFWEQGKIDKLFSEVTVPSVPSAPTFERKAGSEAPLVPLDSVGSDQASCLQEIGDVQSEVSTQVGRGKAGETSEADTPAITIGEPYREADIIPMKETVLQFLKEQRKPVTERELLDSIEGRESLKVRALRSLVSEGEVMRGEGGQGDPYKYFICPF